MGQLRAVEGAEVRLEPLTAPNWTRGPETLTLASTNEHLHVLGLVGTVGTPPDGISAEVVYVPWGLKDAELEALVRGKIAVLGEAPGRTSGHLHSDFPYSNSPYVTYRISNVARHGAKAALVRSPATEGDSDIRSGMATYLYGGPEPVPEIPVAAISSATADRLLAAETATSRTVHLKLRPTEATTVPSANIVAELRGSEHPEEVVVFGANLDSWDQGQGVRDNGTGVITSMAAFELLQRLGVRPRRTIRLVLWADGRHRMSGAAAYWKAHIDDDHAAALEVGPGWGSIQGLLVPETRGDHIPARTEAIATMAAPLTHVGVHGVHQGFAGQDVLPLQLSDVPTVGFAFEHGPFELPVATADVLGGVDGNSLRQNVIAVAATVFMLADTPERLPVEGRRPLPQQALCVPFNWDPPQCTDNSIVRLPEGVSEVLESEQ